MWADIVSNEDESAKRNGTIAVDDDGCDGGINSSPSRPEIPGAVLTQLLSDSLRHLRVLDDVEFGSKPSFWTNS